MRHPFMRRKLLLCIAGTLSITVALGGGALAAGSSVTLKLKGEYAKRHRAACHKRENFRLYHRGSTIEYKGFLTPPPAGHFPVRLEVKHCVGGRFVQISSRDTVGKKLTGKYKGFFGARALAPRSHKPRAINYYFARTVLTGARSRKVFFAVTN